MDIGSALDYFQNALGLTRNQAAGIVGNLYGESSFKHTAVGDGGKAYGLAQWHPDRQANFKSAFGKDIKNATLREQLEFVVWELKNTERAALKDLVNQTSVADATKSFMNKFERPAEWAKAQSFPDRLKAAQEALGGKLGASVTGAIGGAIDDAVGAVTGAVTPDFVKDIMSGEAPARIVAIAVGVIFIGIAIIAFVFSNDKVQEIAKSTVTKGIA